MLSVHVVLCLPLVWNPGVVPCIICFSSLSDFFLMMCPKYVKFLAFTDSRRFLDTPALPSNQSFAIPLQCKKSSCRKLLLRLYCMCADRFSGTITLYRPTFCIAEYPVLPGLTLTLIQPATKWMHWATLRRHSCLSRAATSVSSQVSVIFRRSFLTVPIQLALGRPGPLSKPALPGTV